MTNDDKVLCVETADGLKPIESTGIKKCLRCGVLITEENDSGWEAFVDSRHAQPICKDCDAKESKERCAHINCKNSPIFSIKVSSPDGDFLAMACKEHIGDLLSGIFALPEEYDFVKVLPIRS